MISARATYDGGRFLNRYRVPLAGKIDAVLFDKTGTLTSDKLAPVSVVNSGAPLHGGAPREESPGESRVCDAGVGAAIVLAGCHSLISIDGNKELLGDPIETAALAGVLLVFGAAIKINSAGPALLLWRPAGTNPNDPNDHGTVADYIPMLVTLGIGSLLGAPLGRGLTHAFPADAHRLLATCGLLCAACCVLLSYLTGPGGRTKAVHRAALRGVAGVCLLRSGLTPPKRYSG